jgi:uncharacterized membrane protein
MMKKLIILCFALMSVMAFAGCARGYDSTTGMNYRGGYTNPYTSYDDGYGYGGTGYGGTGYGGAGTGMGTGVGGTGPGTGYNGVTNVPVR